ncbi:MAG: hypothetical protein ACJ788_02090, partial [Ktedonobacteraceae bacterium]
MSTCPHPQILPWLRIHLQRVKVRSIALTVAFSDQMYHVASTPTFHAIYHLQQQTLLLVDSLAIDGGSTCYRGER